MWQSSLQSAFESLDAASGASSGDGVEEVAGPLHLATHHGGGSEILPAGRSIASFKAQPRSESIECEPDAQHALAGGPSMEQMRQNAIARHRRQEQLRVQAISRESALAEGSTAATGRVGVAVESPPHSVSAIPTLDESVSPPKKRILTWAAKRDRRNARRRPSPPLTRRRAAAKESLMALAAPALRSEEDENFFNHRAEMSVSLPSLHIDRPGERSEVTDPSSTSTSNVGPIAAAQISSSAPLGRGKRAKRVAAVLDLTTKDCYVPDSIQSSLLSTQPSSQTQSESECAKRPVVHAQSGSETEDEACESPLTRIAAPPPPTRRKVAAQPSERRSSAAHRAARLKKPTREKIATHPARKTKASDQGRPLFKGFVFVVIGFWSKVRSYGKLIIKHGGLLVQPTSIDLSTVTHVVCCPHAAFRPDPPAVRRALAQWCEDRPALCADLTLRCTQRHAKLLDVRWISDCIEKCLTKDQLLSIDDYQLHI